jgi:DNA-binding MarR family transcriptional regulator
MNQASWKRRCEEVAIALERVQRLGLTDGQVAILNALESWFDENPEPPKSMQAIADIAGVSRGLVWISLPVLEQLGYVQLNRDKQGRLRHRGIILLMALGEEEL